MEVTTLEATNEKKSGIIPPFRKLKSVAKSAGDRGKQLAQNLAHVTKSTDLKKVLVEGKQGLTSKAQNFAHVTKNSAMVGSENLRKVLDMKHESSAEESAKEESSSSAIEITKATESEYQLQVETLLDDRVIFWVVVASVFVVRNLENWRSVVQNQFHLELVLAWMLVAFSVGLEVDLNVLIGKFKMQVLGLEEPSSLGEAKSLSHTAHEAMAKFGIKSLLGQASRKSREAFRQINPKTALKRKQSALRHEKIIVYHINLRRQLHRFRHKRDHGAEEELGSEEAEPSDSALSREVGHHTIGSYDLGKASADKLRDKVEVEPLFRLRGLDIFLTDFAEEEMATHPFLLKNGLRDCPTLMVNLLTQWGTILVYFEMPSWVQNFDKSLEESDDDADDVKALKRFLKGDDAYRKPRLKIIQEIVEAPYPVRMMAPKGSELNVQRDGLVETSYFQYERVGNYAPILEVTVDLLSNSAIRGMASLVKRYLNWISIDIAAVISQPEGQTEDEPEACLGLFRLDHIDISNYGPLPDRYATEGASDESIDTIRASNWVQKADRISAE